MALNIEQENQRHQAGWTGFVRFTAASSAFVVVVLALMGLFLL